MDPNEAISLAAEFSVRPNRFVYALYKAAVTGNFVEREVTFLSKSGRRIPVICTVSALRNESDEVIGLLGTALDISERKALEGTRDRQYHELISARAQLEAQKTALERANDRLRDLAATDGLTGLRNYKSFQDHLATEVKLADRYGNPLSVLMLDVDLFKQINDCFGHLYGDEVLRRLAEILRAESRVTDIVARYGGEEFAVISRNTAADKGLELAERLRSAIESEPWPNGSVTASLGIADTLTVSCDVKRLVESADEALYLSKREGRNRCTVFSQPHSRPTALHR